jgi:hypothetical protein
MWYNKYNYWFNKHKNVCLLIRCLIYLAWKYNVSIEFHLLTFSTMTDYGSLELVEKRVHQSVHKYDHDISELIDIW